MPRHSFEPASVVRRARPTAESFVGPSDIGPLVVNSTGGHPPLELKPTQDPGREHHFNLVQGRWLQFSQLGYVPYRDVQFAGADGDWDNCPTSREELVGNGRITYYTDLN